MTTTFAVYGGFGTSLTAFLLVIVAAFFLCLIVGASEDTISGFLTANRTLASLRNGIAMCGDYISVTALLVPVGTIALAGQDGMAFTASSIAALIILLLLAEPVRRTGAFTLGGVLNTRFTGQPVRAAAAVVTLLVCVPLTVVQLKVASNGHLRVPTSGFAHSSALWVKRFTGETVRRPAIRPDAVLAVTRCRWARWPVCALPPWPVCFYGGA
ncbi:sodium:solute symporter family transporter [Streptomyces sp. NPDC001927]